MRTAILCTLLLFVATTAIGQQITSLDTLTRQDYLQKSRSQKTSGLIFLGLGATMIAIAAPGNVSLDVAPVLAIGGGACVIGSIPLLLASGRNKRIARRLSAHLEWQPNPARTYTRSALPFSPALSVKVGL